MQKLATLCHAETTMFGVLDLGQSAFDILTSDRTNTTKLNTKGSNVVAIEIDRRYNLCSGIVCILQSCYCNCIIIIPLLGMSVHLSCCITMIKTPKVLSGFLNRTLCHCDYGHLLSDNTFGHLFSPNTNTYSS